MLTNVSLSPYSLLSRGPCIIEMLFKYIINYYHQCCFLVVLSDVGIVVKSKHFWAGDERQAPQVIYVALVWSLGRCKVYTTWR